MPAWKKGGSPVLSTATNLKSLMDNEMSFVLIDLRPEKDAAGKHLSGAVNYPSDVLADRKQEFPADKSAPVILYGEDTTSGLSAFQTVRAWGYKNTSVLQGGISGWLKGGNPAASHQLATKIVYVPKPLPGEIQVDEFKKIVETLPADKYILDARDEDESMQGMLKGAHNTPAQDVAESLSEIPKDREIIIHCITGIRAEMAYQTLVDRGYKARFLNAKISIDADGKYEITPN